jgi:DNA topoisomerase-1
VPAPTRAYRDLPFCLDLLVGTAWLMPRLRRSNCSGPGYTRRRRGKGFEYLDAAGRRVADPKVLERIRALVIPPAWQQVWICPTANGHIQATGVDARGRTQYRYHDQWRVMQDRQKFEHMLVFGRVLPDLRRRLEPMLAGEDVADELGEQRVLACAVRLLDLGFFRIGSDSYAEENQTYGLATLQKRHARVDGDTVTFDFVAKGGKRRLQSLVDPHVAEVVDALKRRRGGGSDLLAYRRRDGRRVHWVDVHSDDINEFVRSIAGINCSAKDFRTWNATVLAAVSLAVGAGATSATAKRRIVSNAMKEVAHYLGNTPAVVRSSYVDPRAVDLYLNGETIAPALSRLADGVQFGQPSTQGAIEEAVLDLLDPEGTTADVDRSGPVAADLLTA